MLLLYTGIERPLLAEPGRLAQHSRLPSWKVTACHDRQEPPIPDVGIRVVSAEVESLALQRTAHCFVDSPCRAVVRRPANRIRDRHRAALEVNIHRRQNDRYQHNNCGISQMNVNAGPDHAHENDSGYCDPTRDSARDKEGISKAIDLPHAVMAKTRLDQPIGSDIPSPKTISVVACDDSRNHTDEE
jgi:hypothetical protein